MGNILKILKGFFEKLSSRPQIDGLEIGEASLEYVFADFDRPKTATLRLPPGIFKNNRLNDAVQFLNYLNKLHQLVAPENPERTLKVTVVLPAWMVYTQSFSVPNVGRDRLKETVNLNLQMISPIPITEANMSSQVIRETPDNFDLLGAFVDRTAIDQLKDLLGQAHFSPIAMEFPALSLTRIIRRSVKLNQNSTLVFQVSSEGLDIFILREGHLYFNYFLSWRSIQGEERTISRSVFDRVVIEEVKRVFDFSLSRFNEAPGGAIVIAPGFEAEVGDLLEKNFNIRAVPLVLPQAAPLFYAALGASLRGRMGSEDGDFETINLGGEGLVNSIYEEQVFDFIALWRNIATGVFLILIISFILADSFLVNQSRGLADQLVVFSASGSQKEITGLVAKAGEFNGLVSSIRSVRGASSPWFDFLSRLGNLAAAGKITIGSLDISSLGAPISLYGSAPDYATVLNFKNALSADSKFTNVNLPITQIAIGSDGTATFSVSFQFNPSG